MGQPPQATCNHPHDASQEAERFPSLLILANIGRDDLADAPWVPTPEEMESWEEQGAEVLACTPGWQDMPMNQLARDIYENNVKKGFYEPHSLEAQDVGVKTFNGVNKLMVYLEAFRKGGLIPIPEDLMVDGLTEEQARAAMAMMLITTEVIETFWEMIKGDSDHEAEEVADIIIRVLDYAAWRKIDVDGAVADKMAKNRDRPFKHGKRF